ncbi:putative nuclease HARBI1 [Aphis craccivora]|uniref:Putative nuclease HARBI1 n=1 Tax=Aphis craccivora TaxID=307492 RepID=A0A6G0W2E6_APHCR|nr:putative nuclease HARBI1 [Aphis craccivora]
MSYLSSSDSGDDELIYNIIKQPVIRPKIFNFIPKVVHSYSDKQFKASFRMERTTAYYIIKTFEDSTFFPQQHMYEPSQTSENYILSYIWFSANKSCLRDVAERFGNGLTTQFRINDRVMYFLIELSPKVINFDEGIVNLAR